MYTQEEITHADGPYKVPEEFTTEFIRSSIDELRDFPEKLKGFFSILKPEQQLAQYRPDGWTFRQVIHHLADSHGQAFTRFKLSLTEDNPVIKPYIQNAWAETFDSLNGDAEDSVILIEMLHKRFVILLDSMSPEDFKKTYFHPEQGKTFTLAYVTGMYAWHGMHHLLQMKRYASNMGWLGERA